MSRIATYTCWSQQKNFSALNYDCGTIDSGTIGIGRLSQIIDNDNTLQWQYDRLGHIIQKDQIIGSLTLSTQYHYDSSGHLDQMTYPSGAVVSYEYSAGQLTRILLNGAVLISDIRYQPFSGVKQWAWGNGSVQQRDYNLAGQLTQQSLGADSRAIEYDPVGNIKTLTDPAYNASFDYDALNELTGVVGGVGDEGFTLRRQWQSLIAQQRIKHPRLWNSRRQQPAAGNRHRDNNEADNLQPAWRRRVRQPSSLWI